MKLLKRLIPVVLIPALLLAVPVAVSAASPTDSYYRSVMDMIQKRYRLPVTDNTLLEGSLKGMFSTMDPYTVYYTREEAQSFFGQIQGTYEGVGISLEKQDQLLVILKVFDSGPAAAAGLMSGDILLEADGHVLTGVSTEEAVSYIKGAAGTSVKLKYRRAGAEFVVDVPRAKIELNPVSTRIIGQTGYLKLESFSSNSAAAVDKALAIFDAQGITRIVMDLRDNPGGEVGQAVAIARHFIPKGRITTLDFKSDEFADEAYDSDLVFPKYKLAVLVNGNSASASEIFAGAVQDTGAGVLIGTQTFGKGKVQQLFPLLTPAAYEKYGATGVQVADGYSLAMQAGVYPQDSEILGWVKITTGVYTTPKGRMIDGKGLTPDVVLSAEETNLKNLRLTPMKETGFVPLQPTQAEVVSAESFLTEAGYSAGDIDGKLDAADVTALKKFQKDQKLISCGVLDAPTRKAMNAMRSSVEGKADPALARAMKELNP